MSKDYNSASYKSGGSTGFRCGLLERSGMVRECQQFRSSCRFTDLEHLKANPMHNPKPVYVSDLFVPPCWLDLLLIPAASAVPCPCSHCRPYSVTSHCLRCWRASAIGKECRRGRDPSLRMHQRQPHYRHEFFKLHANFCYAFSCLERQPNLASSRNSSSRLHCAWPCVARA